MSSSVSAALAAAGAEGALEILSGTAAAAGIAAINSVGNLAGFASPYLIGYLKDLTGSTQIGMYVLSAVLVLGAIGVWLVPRKLVNR